MSALASANRFAVAVTAAACALLLGALPARAEPGDVRLPTAERIVLENGATVLLVPRRDTPLISLVAQLRGGALGDPAGKDGTAQLFTSLIQKGAGTRDAASFAEAIESAGGELGAAAGVEHLTVAADFLSVDAGLMVELVSDVLLRPRLDPAEFTKARELAVQSITAAKDGDPSGLIDDYGSAWLFRGHAYGRPSGGSERSLATIELEDLRRYYADHVGADRLFIVAVGDFEPADMRRRLETAFGGWRKAAQAAPVAAPTARVGERRVLLVDRPGSTQTYFWLGDRGAMRSDPARTAQSLVNTVFGGRYTSMLNTELRAKSGLTYGASSGFERLSQPGSFRISSFTQTDKTGEALDLALATLARLHEEGLDAQALESAKRYTLGQFPPTLETNGQLAGRLAEIERLGLGVDDVDGFAARVRSADAAAIRSAIDTSFPQPDRLAIVLIGDAAKIRDTARRFGPVTEMKLSDPSFAP
jgi:predicted Zn-dependent peptidase